MDIFGGRFFVRKFKGGIGPKRPVTAVLLLIDGDVPSLTGETMYKTNKIIDVAETLTIGTQKPESVGKHEGWLFEDILKVM